MAIEILRIEEEMTRLMSSLCDLRFQRNTLLPISRLPTEILVEIFVHGARDRDHCEPAIGVPKWVNVSYVCRQWRDVALNCPTLWGHLFMGSPQWTEELLARSGRAPLKIYMDISYPLEEWLCPFVEKVADRAEDIQELCLDLWSEGYCPSLDPFLRPCSRAPRLQVLEIQGSYRSCSSVQRIFNGETPSLRKLDLTNVDMPWYSFPLSNLISLSVKNVCNPSQLTMVEHLSVLRSMHGLVDLHLCDALPSARSFLADADINTFQTVNLPHLSRLLIRAPFSTVVAFLSCVNTPPGAEIKLYCEDEDETIPDVYYRLSSHLAQKFRSATDQVPSVPRIRMLAINFARDQVFFGASERDCGHIHYHDESDEYWGCDILQLTIKFEKTMMKLDRVHILSDICCNVCPKDVQTIHIGGPPFSSTFWESALSHFQELQYLKVTAGGILDLASALSLVHPDDMESQPGHVGQGSRLLCAPGLEELELEYKAYHSIHDINSLRTALSTRKGHGRALKRFVINDRRNKFDLKDVSDLPVGEVWMNDERLLKSD